MLRFKQRSSILKWWPCWQKSPKQRRTGVSSKTSLVKYSKDCLIHYWLLPKVVLKVWMKRPKTSQRLTFCICFISMRQYSMGFSRMMPRQNRYNIEIDVTLKQIARASRWSWGWSRARSLELLFVFFLSLIDSRDYDGFISKHCFLGYL